MYAGRVRCVALFPSHILVSLASTMHDACDVRAGHAMASISRCPCPACDKWLAGWPAGVGRTDQSSGQPPCAVAARALPASCPLPARRGAAAVGGPTDGPDRPSNKTRVRRRNSVLVLVYVAHPASLFVATRRLNDTGQSFWPVKRNRRRSIDRSIRGGARIWT